MEDRYFVNSAGPHFGFQVAGDIEFRRQHICVGFFDDQLAFAIRVAGRVRNDQYRACEDLFSAP